MSLDHLDTLASAAGFAAVPDDEEPTSVVPARLRYRTPDAPAPRRSAVVSTAVFVPPQTASALPAAAASARDAVTHAVGSALKTAQGLVSFGRAPA